MKLGYHDVNVVSYTTGVNDNGTKLMEIDVVNDDGEHERVTLYFASPKNIQISLNQLRALGWSKNHPEGLDAILEAFATIEIYEEPWEDRNGASRVSRKARFARTDRPSSIKSALSKDAADAWLDGLDKS